MLPPEINSLLCRDAYHPVPEPSVLPPLPMRLALESARLLSLHPCSAAGKAPEGRAVLNFPEIASTSVEVWDPLRSHPPVW